MMNSLRITVLAFSMVSCCWAQGDEPMSVPIGVTDLLSEGTPVVSYQYFGQAPSMLGYAWTGFDETSGVYFVPEPAEGGLTQIFMHCPWRGGKGTASAEYSLAMPEAARIRLALQIGLRPGAKGTDGVTYRVKADDEALFDEHCTWKEFRSFEVDLSAFAGKRVGLGLQVDPGPARETADDWSLWRDVRILAGTPEQIAEANERLAAEARGRRAAELEKGESLAKTRLDPLTTHENTAICPSVLVPTKVSVQQDGKAYLLQCEGDETIAYRFDPRAGPVESISVMVDGKALEGRIFTGGPRVHLDGVDLAVPTKRLDTELVSSRLSEGKLFCEYRYTHRDTGSSAHLSVVLWPQGKSLGLQLRGEPGKFSGFAAQPAGGKAVPAAYAVGGPPVWRPEGVYVSTVFDLMRSNASGVHNGGVTYTPLTDGTRNALGDLCYLTVTSRYEEVFPNLTHRPSPFLKDLARRVVLDVWGGAFAKDETWLKDMAAYGIDSLLIIKHVWQRDGYDHTYPNTMPANAGQGGDAALRSLSLAARRLGHYFNVHENYYDYYPNAEAFRQEDRCLNARGEPIPGWDNGSVRAVILKPSKLMDYVREFTPEIRRRYECNSAYHDIMPTWHVDYDAGAPMAGKIRATHEYTRELCDYDREIFGGPVVFEAASPHMAGVYDGGCNHGVDTYRTPVAVAHELLKVHPKMSNHGFGYYERWLPWGYGPGWGSYVMTDRELDKYRAYQIAFGRTGFIGQQLIKHPHAVVREYHLMQAFGRAYTGRLVQRIEYEVDGKWVDAGTAARYGEFDRLHVEYEAGQHVYVNLAPETLTVQGHALPRFGALTAGPRATAWTALVDGQICDYAEYGDITYADSRSHVWQPPAVLPPIEPSLEAFEDLGGGEFELAVNWRPSRRPQRDYIAFWHFKHNGKIEFQYDHKLTTAPTSWQVGQAIIDGPHRLRVKDDANATSYDIFVGLYDSEGRAKLVLGADEVRIGRIVVQRDGDKATKVSFESASMTRPPGSDPAEYLEGANVDARTIDLGKVATNGAVVLRTTDAGVQVVPVPQGTPMTVGLAGRVRKAVVVAVDEGVAAAAEPRQHGGKAWFDIPQNTARLVVAPLSQ